MTQASTSRRSRVNAKPRKSRAPLSPAEKAARIAMREATIKAAAELALVNAPLVFDKALSSYTSEAELATIVRNAGGDQKPIRDDILAARMVGSMQSRGDNREVSELRAVAMIAINEKCGFKTKNIPKSKSTHGKRTEQEEKDFSAAGAWLTPFMFRHNIRAVARKGTGAGRKPRTTDGTQTPASPPPVGSAQIMADAAAEPVRSRETMDEFVMARFNAMIAEIERAKQYSASVKASPPVVRVTLESVVYDAFEQIKKIVGSDTISAVEKLKTKAQQAPAADAE